MNDRRAPSIAKSFRNPTAIIFFSLVLIYLATLTSNYYWDGITFALRIEKVANGERRAETLFHQNHLLYNPVVYLVYRVTQAMGAGLRALTLMQAANCLIGAAAIAVFYRLAGRETRSRYAAVVCSMALALSAVWWELSTDADAYILSVFLILVCADNLLGAKPRWWLAGVSLAGAMLVHQLAALFYFAAITAIFLSSNIKRKLQFAAAASALAWGATVAIYYVCAVLLRDLTEPLGVIGWAVSNPSEVSASLNPVRGILLLPRASLKSFIGHDFALFQSQGGWLESGFALAAFASAIAFAFAIRRGRFADLVANLKRAATAMKESRASVTLAVWVCAYVVFLIFWEPWQLYYRVFYAPALALLFGILLSRYRSVVGRESLDASGARLSGAAALAVATLALFNLAFFIMPHTRENTNALISAARNARSIWNSDTVIYFDERNEADTAFEYFNEATSWRRLLPEKRANLNEEIERAHKRGASLWLNKSAIESLDPNWLAERAGQQIKIEAPNAPAHYIQLLPER